MKCREALLEWRAGEGWACEDHGGRPCEDFVGLSMCDGMIETVKYIWVNISVMLD